MSVIFALIHENFIAICADKQATNLTTLDAEPGEYQKIRLWTPFL
jgi:hypothetical protein